MFKFNFSIRLRVLALIAGALFLSLGSYLYIGSRLVIEDKTSYIYDYSFSQVRLASLAIQSELEKINEFKGRIQLKDATAIEAEFRSEENFLQANSLLIYHASIGIDQKPKLDLEKSVGMNIGSPKLPWTEGQLTSGKLQLQIDPTSQTLTAGLGVGSGRYVVLQMKLSHPLFDGTAKDFEILVLDETGQIITSKNPAFAATLQPIPKDLMDALIKTEFDSGVHQLDIGERPYLMGYDQVLSNHIFVVSLVPAEMAMSAAKALAKRSLGLGVSIFLLAIGSTLLLIRTFLLRVKELVDATNRVSTGDFSTKIRESTGLRDELSALAESFNRMGDEIQQLLKKTAANARMEQELETAQLVQSRFFPPNVLITPNLLLHGSSLPASEVGGDWWHYAQVQNYLVVIMGDATGHGASAALITASVHSAFSLMIAELQRVKKPLRPDTEILSILSNSLNQALLLTAGEQSTFPALLAVIDLESLKMWTFNAGHPKPYLFRAGTKQYEAMAAESSIPLGQKAFKFEPKLSITDLNPGDQVLWYTDGLFDSRISDGKKMKKKALLEEIKGKIDLISKNIGNPGAISLADLVLTQTEQFFGGSNNQSDDITVLSILTPLSARPKVTPNNTAT